MTIDRFSPGLIATVTLVSLASGGLVIGYLLWAGIEMSIHGYLAIFLGTFFTALVGFGLGLAMHISQVRDEAAEDRLNQTRMSERQLDE
ncbi:MAG: hypothetical protein U1E53_08120 [Dongiaceae bacterium]